MRSENLQFPQGIENYGSSGVSLAPIESITASFFIRQLQRGDIRGTRRNHGMHFTTVQLNLGKYTVRNREREKGLERDANELRSIFILVANVEGAAPMPPSTTYFIRLAKISVIILPSLSASK